MYNEYDYRVKALRTFSAFAIVCSSLAFAINEFGPSKDLCGHLFIDMYFQSLINTIGGKIEFKLAKENPRLSLTLKHLGGIL